MEKKRHYNDRVLEVENGSSPLVFPYMVAWVENARRFTTD